MWYKEEDRKWSSSFRWNKEKYENLSRGGIYCIFDITKGVKIDSNFLNVKY